MEYFRPIQKTLRIVNMPSDLSWQMEEKKTQLSILIKKSTIYCKLKGL